MIDSIKEFLKLEAAAGILLLLAAVLAMLSVNSPLSPLYDMLLGTPVAVQVGKLIIDKPLLLWINDGLMALFFLLIGLELKREALEGNLRQPSNVVLPAIAALGGIAVPAAIYYLLNADDPIALRGWAIPTATDIAFALGILALLGNRVPVGLKLFLLTLAIIDDLGAVLIIAFFYSQSLSTLSLTVGAGAVILLAILNRRGVDTLTPYLITGLVLWIAVLKSGVHATLAGVVLALFIPIKTRNSNGHSPLKQLEHDLHGTVSFFILPLFAFANAGVSLKGISIDAFTAGVPLGIILGLFLGKQLGVFGVTWLAVKSGLAQLPEGVSWRAMYGVSLLCGVGFTMSLFIGSLAFEGSGPGYAVDDRLGILTGSVLSAVAGWVVLHLWLPRDRAAR